MYLKFIWPRIAFQFEKQFFIHDWRKFPNEIEARHSDLKIKSSNQMFMKRASAHNEFMSLRRFSHEIMKEEFLGLTKINFHFTQSFNCFRGLPLTLSGCVDEAIKRFSSVIGRPSPSTRVFFSLFSDFSPSRENFLSQLLAVELCCTLSWFEATGDTSQKSG